MSKKTLIKIHNNWLERFPFLYPDEVECVVCGAEKHLEKCHLIPDCLGGDNTPDNLILLCHEHHRQAPNTCVDKDIMLDWVDRKAENHTKVRGLNMTNELFDRFFIVGDRFVKTLKEKLGSDFVDDNKVKEIMDFISEKCTVVSSHSKYNYKETIINNMEFFCNNENKLDVFLQEFLDKDREVA